MHQGLVSKDNAGFSDFVLSKYPNRSGQVAVFEFKAFWNYFTNTLLEHYFGGSIENLLDLGTDSFAWGGKNTAPRELLKQVGFTLEIHTYKLTNLTFINYRL